MIKMVKFPMSIDELPPKYVDHIARASEIYLQSWFYQVPKLII
jgi:hypothetical protein